VLLETRFIY